ncbi:MAG: NAD(P)(+) transhydrogenase (Re/Si-specific) subunit beta, partial [Pyrinomonadaceae bacterium]
MQVPYLIEITYLVASVLFIYGLKAMSHPTTARRGMNAAAFGMLAAVVGTLLNREIISYEWIIIGLVIGSIIGAAMSIWMPMTAMPQRTALSHAFGALAATIVGIAEFYRHAPEISSFKMSALGFEVL